MQTRQKEKAIGLTYALLLMSFMEKNKEAAILDQPQNRPEPIIPRFDGPERKSKKYHYAEVRFLQSKQVVKEPKHEKPRPLANSFMPRKI